MTDTMKAGILFAIAAAACSAIGWWTISNGAFAWFPRPLPCAVLEDRQARTRLESAWFEGTLRLVESPRVTCIAPEMRRFDEQCYILVACGTGPDERSVRLLSRQAHASPDLLGDGSVRSSIALPDGGRLIADDYIVVRAKAAGDSNEEFFLDATSDGAFVRPARVDRDGQMAEFVRKLTALRADRRKAVVEASSPESGLVEARRLVGAASADVRREYLELKPLDTRRVRAATLADFVSATTARDAAKPYFRLEREFLDYETLLLDRKDEGPRPPSADEAGVRLEQAWAAIFSGSPAPGAAVR